MRIGILGVPFNSDGTTGGVALAPAALRARGLIDALRRVVDVWDAGDVAIGPESPDRDVASAIIAPDRAGAMSQAVSLGVQRILAAGPFPIVIGGDCPVLFGCLSAATAVTPNVGLLYVDGHEDAYPPTRSPTGELADMDLGLLLGRSLDGLPASLRAAIPVIPAAHVAILGARDAGEAEAIGVGSLREDVAYFADDVQLAADPRRVIADATARVAEQAGRVWLHLDLDVLSTTALAAVDYPQPGGIDWPTLMVVCTRAMRIAGGPLGWDITIYNPELDQSSQGCDRIIATVMRVLEAATEGAD